MMNQNIPFKVFINSPDTETNHHINDIRFTSEEGIRNKSISNEELSMIVKIHHTEDKEIGLFTQLLEKMMTIFIQYSNENHLMSEGSIVSIHASDYIMDNMLKKIKENHPLLNQLNEKGLIKII